MPQMAPTMWLVTMNIFLISMFIMMIWIFFYKSSKMVNEKKDDTTNPMVWLW